MDATYVLTAEMDNDSFAWLDSLRRQHFPAERNFLPAYLTLFQTLSSRQISGLRSFGASGIPPELHFDRILFLGSDVVIHVESAGLKALREAIRTSVGEGFSRQDNQPWSPHVTIQNKVSAKSARELHRVLEASFASRAGIATGLLIWEYLGGPWRLSCRIPLGASS